MGLVPCSRVPQQCSGGELTALQLTVHTQYWVVQAGLALTTFQSPAD